MFGLSRPFKAEGACFLGLCARWRAENRHSRWKDNLEDKVKGLKSGRGGAGKGVGWVGVGGQSCSREDFCVAFLLIRVNMSSGLFSFFTLCLTP